VGAPFDSSGDGAAYLFESDQSGFTCASRLRAPNRTQGFEPVVADEVFGTWVAAGDDSFFVGAPRAPVSSRGNTILEAGAVHRFAFPK
jgi:hypothetical protein